MSETKLSEPDEKPDNGRDQPTSDATISPSPSPRKAGFLSRKRILGPLEKDHGDLALLACCFVTGMVDAAAFSNYSVFVGMQTGNTVILGLSTVGVPGNPYAWLTTLISIASFLVGAFVTFRLSKAVTPKGATSNRLWTSTLFLSQGLMLLLAAALATPNGVVPHNAPGSVDDESGRVTSVAGADIVALIPPMAFNSGIQIASSRLLGYNELPVNVLTSTYCDLMGDYRLFALNNVKRTRRAAAVVLLLAGSIASAWLLQSPAGLTGVLWISAGIKLMTGLAIFCFAPALKEKALP